MADTCPHDKHTETTSTSFSTKRVWDDVAEEWVAIEMKTVKTVTTCTDCHVFIASIETTS